MSDRKGSDPNEMPPSAQDLRDLQEAMKQKATRATEAKEKSHFDLVNDFMFKHVTENEIQIVRRLVDNALRDGKTEALVYQFSSDFCTDSGRAINNGADNWPETLQGKAKEFYERYEKYGRPQGYKLKAVVVNFPSGMPGDVGFFLNWEPDKPKL